MQSVQLNRSPIHSANHKPPQPLNHPKTNMETQVLIPQEFSLVVTASGARHSAEPNVSVWTTDRINQGALFYPFQGTVRIDNLDMYSYIDEEDVSVHACLIAVD